MRSKCVLDRQTNIMVHPAGSLLRLFNNIQMNHYREISSSRGTFNLSRTCTKASLSAASLPWLEYRGGNVRLGGVTFDDILKY